MIGIIQLGGISFSYRFQRPQHFAVRLAKRYPTIYVEPILGRETIERIRDDLYLGHLEGSGIARQAVDANPQSVTIALNSLTKKLGITKPILVFDYPYWSPVLQYYKPYKVIYNCMDDYTEFFDLRPFKDKINNQERFLFGRADLVAATAHGLYEKAKEHSKKTILLPNACDPAHFDIGDIERPEELPYGDIIGYIGCIARWFDQTAMAYMADQLPYYNFVLIGNSSVNIEMLKRRKNIYLYGEQTYQKIPMYLKFFDVAIIPFNANMNIVKNCNPVKMYEYLAAGKPIVSSPLPEVLRANKDILIADETEDWDKAILAAHERATKIKDFSKRQKASIRKDTWDHRADKLLEELRNLES